MKLTELAHQIGARLYPPPGQKDRDIGGVYAGDRISDLIERASSTTMLVTNLANTQLVRVAELMDVPAICLLSGAEPPADLLAAAWRSGTGIMVSSGGMFETCGKLYGCFTAGEAGP